MPALDREIRVGAAQVAEVFMDAAATVEKDVAYIEEAGREGLDLLVFPEFHVAASPAWERFTDEMDWREYYRGMFESAVTVPGPEIERIQAAAAAADLAVVLGVNERDPDTTGTMYNTQVFVDADGTLLGKRRKLVPTVHERIFHDRGSGRGVRTFDSAVGRLGGLICSEHHNPLAVFGTLAQGEEIHAAAWPGFAWWDRERREHRVGLRSKYHAFAGAVPTVVATGVVDEALAEAIGRPDWGPDSGCSAVVDTEGEYLAGPKFEGEGLVYADVDMGSRVDSKAVHDVVGHYNRFDVFTLEIDRSEPGPLRFVGDGASPAADGVAAPDRLPNGDESPQRDDKE
ncbi:carbon-nitrogen hydrolase family protein [Halobacteriales archaeon Cl-PHB]